jgi:hypothetical protein
MEQVSKLSPARLKRFFLKGAGAQAGKVRIRPEVAAMVKFEQLNLLDAKWALREPFDAIFCRNVMIYFDKPTQAPHPAAFRAADEAARPAVRRAFGKLLLRQRHPAPEGPDGVRTGRPAQAGKAGEAAP